MPDDDKLPRSLGARWQRVLKAFRAGESQEAIEHHVAKAAAETLRRAHGVPALPALGEQMYLDATTGYGADDSSRRAMPAHIPTRLARQAVDALSAVMMNPAISGLSSPAARFASNGSAPVPLRFGGRSRYA
jgi:hypothetical protein